MQPQVQTGSSPVIQSNKGFRVWWQLTRPHTLTAAFVPVLLGTVLAIDTHDIHIGLFLSMLIASLLIQAATNMFNEYYDFKRGLDNENSVGIGGTIVRDGVQPKTVLKLAFGFYGLAFLLGLYICANSSWWLALIGIICMAAGYFYTGGPLPIAYTPFGEVVAGFFMGILIILIAYFLQTGTVDTISILVSIPISILVGQILMANNIRDLDGDKINGRKTLAILLGRKNAIRLLGVMFAVSYVWIFAMIFTGTVSPWLAVIILSVPKAIKATKGFIGKTMPIEMMPAMKATAQTNTIFGFLLSVGLLINYIITL
ncbi:MULTISPECIES: 1,4-dihydroxy-2-naphthoate polyprenyltransferase [unclassified Bacillus (in: firmicutes)]|uniref:1,4-dihydroxy-2-naphthoate polyprenyltransferase n=1 Tax=unclassified Bacillus (in: firmicutes) TaxID=185979 RepID=UPI0008E35C72|nr:MULTISPECIES: 1,4-dihydroxy-2-naphthoate polyprenyltransferase [unclassified Bacillus (in: firmicutes)]SFB18501.1 1,4-dihydroxy-2-naphthoate prenyltransferase [Bacillus sp. UNCCL13]SFQ75933.1 1,4-dihydroxy-2-naphthoate prenyltransferase [Bacillus sp. cl95]